MTLNYLQYVFLKYAFRFAIMKNTLSVFFSLWINEIRHSLDKYLVDVFSEILCMFLTLYMDQKED